MSKLERDVALIQLAELQVAIDDLETAGLDVTTMRRQAVLLAEGLRDEEEAHKIEAWLRSLPDEEVIQYQVQFPGNRAVYKFAAVKVNLLWFTTARSGRRQFSSHELAQWMAHQVNLVGCVRLRVVKATDPFRRPDVEMRMR
jgi:hypothetical protein